MTKNEFKHNFFRGLGSAIVEIEKCSDKSQYKDIVLYACLNNTTYDMQCEGDRGYYLYNSINILNQTDEFEKCIIDRFFNIRDDHWLFEQLTSLLYYFAEDGSKKARDALYTKYEFLYQKLIKMRKQKSICFESDVFEWLSVWLTSLDGLKAFRKISFDIGLQILNGKEDFFRLIGSMQTQKASLEINE
jgi:hypothetical protein